MVPTGEALNPPKSEAVLVKQVRQGEGIDQEIRTKFFICIVVTK